MPDWLREFISKLKDNAIGVIVGIVVAAGLTFFAYLFKQGGIVSMIGGVTTNQLAQAKEYRVFAVCPGFYLNDTRLGRVDKVFCAITETSTFASATANARGVGWRVCKIEPKQYDKDSLYLKAEMWADAEQMCIRDPGAQIVCRARCISLGE
jgi:hypothetical protein